MTKRQMILIGLAVVLVPLLIVVLYNALFIAPQFAESGAEARGLSVMRIGNPVIMNQTLDVNGDTRLKSDLTVTGDIVASSIVTEGNAALTTVSTTGNITAEGTITSAVLRVTGASTLDGATTVGGGFGATGCTFSAAGVLQCNGAATIGGAATITGALTLGGYAQSGAVRFGETANVISGTTIAHGFGTTPTIFIPRNYGQQGVAFTQTLYAFGCNTTTCAIGVGQGSVITFTVDWIAGR